MCRFFRCLCNVILKFQGHWRSTCWSRQGGHTIFRWLHFWDLHMLESFAPETKVAPATRNISYWIRFPCHKTWAGRRCGVFQACPCLWQSLLPTHGWLGWTVSPSSLSCNSERYQYKPAPLWWDFQCHRLFGGPQQCSCSPEPFSNALESRNDATVLLWCQMASSGLFYVLLLSQLPAMHLFHYIFQIALISDECFLFQIFSPFLCDKETCFFTYETT